MNINYKRLKLACYSGNITMAVVGALSPLLFLTFRSTYGISYSLLGLLVLVNFSTQLGIDLVFSFFSHKFNIPKTVKLMPLIAVVGFLVYAIWPYFMPDSAYVGILIGTILFSASSGLAEVLLSPIIAEIPAENPDREMSKLHSVFAWGAVAVVIFGTLFLYVFGSENWQCLTLIYTMIPLSCFLLFRVKDIPPMKTPEKTSGAIDFVKNKGVWLCVAGIFFGGASECTMSQWSSGYLEQALGIPKIWGDIFGVALFSVMLGMGRTLYTKYGKNIEKVLLMGSAGAVLCYLITAISPIPWLGLICSAFTGFCVSMLWPGSLVVASDRFPQGGVMIFALMAAGGDFGASVGPQLVGVITDMAMESEAIVSLAQSMGLMPEQMGMKLGMLVGMLFPICGTIVFACILKTRKESGK